MNIEQWHHEGSGLQEELRAYDWQYRKKICVKCPLEQQKKRKCFRPDSFKVIQGVKIQETHCAWIDKARVRKYKSKINAFMNMGFRRMRGNKT